MRFKLGKTLEERNKRYEKAITWQPYFCLLPLEVEPGLWAWLENIEIRECEFSARLDMPSFAKDYEFRFMEKK